MPCIFWGYRHVKTLFQASPNCIALYCFFSFWGRSFCLLGFNMNPSESIMTKEMGSYGGGFTGCKQAIATIHRAPSKQRSRLESFQVATDFAAHLLRSKWCWKLVRIVRSRWNWRLANSKMIFSVLYCEICLITAGFGMIANRGWFVKVAGSNCSRGCPPLLCHTKGLKRSSSAHIDPIQLAHQMSIPVIAG